MHILVSLLLLAGMATGATASDNICIISGSVVGTDGIGLPGVNIELSSSALAAGPRRATTDAVGEFRFARLTNGEYKLVVTFAEHRRERTLLMDSQTAQLVQMRVVLEVRSDGRRVSRRSRIIDDATSIRKSTAHDYLDAEFLQNVPNRRDVWEAVELVPGYIESSGLGAPVNSGNAYLIDGTAVGNPADSTAFGNMNYEAVDHITVEALGADVRRGLYTGASINVITRSGSNIFSGEANYFYRAADWTRDNTSKYEKYDIEPESGEKLIDPNVALGGPLLKNRSWFFFSHNYRKREVERVLADEELLAVTRDNGSGRILAKINGQWNPEHMTTVSYFGGENTLSHFPQMGQWRINREGSLLSEQRDDKTWLLEHTYALDDDLYFDLRASRLLGSLDVLPVQPGETKFDIPQNIFLPDSGNTFSSKSELERNLVGAEMTYFNDDFSGTHNIVFGLEYERNRSWRAVSDEENGTYWDGERYRLFDNGSFEAGVIIKRYSGYIQDSWSMTDNLVVTIGVRFDHSGYTAEDPDSAPAGTEQFLAFTDSAYRIGIAYDLFGTGETVLRGFAGRYYEGPTVGAAEVMALRYPPERLFYGSVLLGPAVGEQWVLWNETQVRNDLIIDEELRNQYTEGFTVALDQRLDDNTAASAAFTWKKDSDIIGSISSDVRYAVNNISYTGTNGFYRGLYYSNIEYTGPRLLTNPQEGDPGVLGPVYRRYWAFILQLQRRLHDHLSFRFSYAYSRNEGTAQNASPDVLQGFVRFDDPNWWVNRDGRLALDRPHKITATATWHAPLDIFFTPLFTFVSGRPYVASATPEEDPVRIDLVDGDTRLDNQLQLDFRLEKALIFRDKYRIGVIFDVFNVFNNTAVTEIVSSDIDSQAYLRPASLAQPQAWQVGIRLLF